MLISHHGVSIKATLAVDGIERLFTETVKKGLVKRSPIRWPQGLYLNKILESLDLLGFWK